MHKYHMSTRKEAALLDTRHRSIGQMPRGSQVRRSSLTMRTLTAYVDV
jgi:hypothetical protein